MMQSAQTPPRYGLLLTLFFVSGASSLMFETLWQRLMILVFGASAPATAAILVAFFLGLAFGSLIGGVLLARFKRALLFYACVELWIGLWSLAVPLLLGAMDHLLIRFGDSNQITALPYLVRLSLSIAIVLPATAGMGATIPVMNRLIHEHGRAIGYSAALGYGINTLGAVFGCLLTGIVLIRAVGVQASLYTASALNAVVVLASLALLRFTDEPALSAPASTPAEDTESRPAPGLARLLFIGYLFSGFLALAYEIVWIRMLGLFTSTSTTTFAIVLAVYLVGFSAGSLALYPRLSARLSGAMIFAASNLITGVSASLLIPLFYYFPHLRVAIAFPDSRMVPVTLARAAMIESLFAGTMMLLPTIGMGLAFPAVCKALIASGKELGRKSGAYYFAGNIGSALGVAATAMIFIPAMGLINSLLTLCAASIVIGLLVFSYTHAGKRRITVALLGVTYLAALFAYGYQALPFVRDGRLERTEDNTLAYTPFGPSWHHSSTVRRAEVLRYQSGRSATIAVKRVTLRHEPDAPFNALYVDELHVASTHAHSTIDAKMLAHIPLLLHPDPQSALTVGFGSGGTSWSMTRYPIRATAVEIEPEVVRSADFFFNQNHGVLDEPNFELILNDARNHLHVTDRRYDVISTDVTNLQYRQNSSLYTREYFQLMKDRLAADGVACAWIPMMAISDTEFKMLLRTFQDVFPHASLWYIDYAYTNFGILIGTPDQTRIDMRRVHDLQNNPAVMADLAAIGLDRPDQIAMGLYLDEDSYRAYVGPGELHTDDRPRLEFLSAVSYYNFNVNDEFGRRLAGIRAARPDSITPLLTNASPADAKRFARYEKLHRLLADAMWLHHFDRDPTLSHADKTARILNLIHEALALDPAFTPARKLLDQLAPAPLPDR